MNPDFVAVFWKEWKEILLERASGGSGLRPLIMVGLIGVVIPLRLDAQRYFSPRPLLGLIFVSLAAVLAVVPDAFAGERERHTLETLLASRLPDRAILFGKLAACLGYGWLLSIITIILGIGVSLGSGALPENVRLWFARTLATWSGAELVLAASAVVLAVDLVLILAAVSCFQRSKLVLD